MIKIQIRKGKHHTAKSVMTGLCYAQKTIAAQMAEAEDEPHDILLSLHASQLSDKFSKIAAKEQKQYTIKLSETEAEAFRQIWGRLVLDYKAYGAVHIQNLLNEINQLM